MERFSNVVHEVLSAAQEAAFGRGQSVVCPEHLLYALLADDRYISVRVLASLGIPVETLRTRAESSIDHCRPSASGASTFSVAAQFVLDSAATEADSFGHYQVGAQDLLLSLVKRGGEQVEAIFGQSGVEVDDLRERVAYFLHRDPALDATRESLIEADPADSPAVAGLIRELAETRAAKRQKTEAGDSDAALLLRAREKGLLGDIAQLRNLDH